MGKRYIVVARTFGDGDEGSLGERVWSQVFNDRAAAKQCWEWLVKSISIRAILIEDEAA